MSLFGSVTGEPPATVPIRIAPLKPTLQVATPVTHSTSIEKTAPAYGARRVLSSTPGLGFSEKQGNIQADRLSGKEVS